MKTLAIEFSSAQRSVALYDGAKLAAAVTETGGRETPAFGMIEKLLSETQWSQRAIECLAIGLGPGSYTGIRTAISLAQGWQLAAGDARLHLLGVSSIECMADEAHSLGWRGRAGFVVDAQRSELYLAIYDIVEEGAREFAPVRLAAIEESRATLAQCSVIAGPEATRWFPEGRLLHPGAVALGRLASARNHYVSGEELQPIYLRETTFVKAPPPRLIPHE